MKDFPPICLMLVQERVFVAKDSYPSIAQLVEHLTVDQRVLSSNLGGRIDFCANISVGYLTWSPFLYIPLTPSTVYPPTWCMYLYIIVTAIESKGFSRS